MNKTAKPTMENYQRYVLVCVGSKCTEHGEGEALYVELKERLKQAGLHTGASRIMRSRAGCFGVCQAGPLLSVQPDGVWYYGVDSTKLDRIIKQHLIAGQPVHEWVYHQGPTIKQETTGGDTR